MILLFLTRFLTDVVHDRGADRIHGIMVLGSRIVPALRVSFLIGTGKGDSWGRFLVVRTSEITLEYIN